MYRALTVSDVLYEIFSCEVDKRTLVALARTCQTFKDPALDLIWEICRNLSILTHVLPKRALVNDKDGSIVDIKTLTSNEWARFYSYSSRILQLGVSESGSTTSSILKLLVSRPMRLGSSAFPRLTHLLINEPRGRPIPLDYRVLLGPRLLDLRLKLAYKPSGSDTNTPSLITSLPRTCPDIGYLDVSWELGVHEMPAWVVKAFSEAVPHLRSLQVLLCPAPNKEAMIALSKLRLLTVLTLHSSPVSYSSIAEGRQMMHSDPIYVFRSVEDLTLTLEHIADGIIFFHQLQNYPSDSLTVFTRISPRIDLLQKFFELFGENGAPGMELISVKHRGTKSSVVRHVREIANPGPPITLNTLFPLLQFEKLGVLDIDIGSPCALADADINAMSLAWPNLEYLMLNQNTGWGNPAVTVEGLYALVRNCPRLVRICMSLDASQLVALPSVAPADGARHDRLQMLHLADCVIGDPVVLVVVLAKLFMSEFILHFHHQASSSTAERLPLSAPWATMECLRQLRKMEREEKVFGDTWPPSEDVVARVRKTYDDVVTVTRTTDPMELLSSILGRR